MTANPGPDPSPGSGPSLFDIVSGIVAGFIAEGRQEVSRAASGDGRITVNVVMNLDGGEISWSRGQCVYERRRAYRSHL